MRDSFGVELVRVCGGCLVLAGTIITIWAMGELVAKWLAGGC